jgi:hypothetical protein
VIARTAYVRFAGVRGLLTALALAVPLFAALFLFWSPVATVVLPREVVAVSVRGAAPTPVVMVVFDEFSSTALMDEKGAIDARRFPSFAALAGEGTWFRNATTVASLTEMAVGAILTGRYPDPTLPDWHALRSQNLFALLAGSHQLRVLESYLPFCPPALCPDADAEEPFAGRMRRMLTDVGVAFLHLVTPADMRASLPGLSTPVLLAGPAAAHTSPGTVKLELFFKGAAHHGASQLFRKDLFEHFLSLIRPDRGPALYYLHILLPHGPFAYLPSGRACLTPRTAQYQWSDPFQSAQAYQRYLEQVGFVDTMIGRLIAHLKAAGLYDRSLLVLVSDHGVSYRTGQLRRPFTAGNQCDIMAVPLFVKTPGQARGGTSDRNVEVVDVLPTIADVLGIQVPWPMDGQSLAREEVSPRRADARGAELAGGSALRRPPSERWARLRPRARPRRQARAVHARRRGADWMLRVGPYAGWWGAGGNPGTGVGRPTARAGSGRARSGGRSGVAPRSCDVAGEIVGPPVPAGELALAVAVNGRIVAVTRGRPRRTAASLSWHPCPTPCSDPGETPSRSSSSPGREAAVLARVERAPRRSDRPR